MAEQRTLNAERAPELAPCPFCGGTETFVERLNNEAAYVQCDSSINEYDSCGARGPIGVAEDDDLNFPGDAAAIRAWNEQAARRAPPALDAEGPPAQWHERTEKMDDLSIISAMKAEIADLREQLALEQEHLRQAVENIAKMRAQFARQSAPEGAPVGVVPSVMRGLCDVIAWIETEDGLCQAVEKADNIKNDDDAFVRLSTVKKLLVTAPTSASAQPESPPQDGEKA